MTQSAMSFVPCGLEEGGMKMGRADNMHVGTVSDGGEVVVGVLIRVGSVREVTLWSVRPKTWESQLGSKESFDGSF